LYSSKFLPLSRRRKLIRLSKQATASRSKIYAKKTRVEAFIASIRASLFSDTSISSTKQITPNKQEQEKSFLDNSGSVFQVINDGKFSDESDQQ
jgi:hypothetical protein